MEESSLEAKQLSQEGALGWDLHRHKKVGAGEGRSEPDHRPGKVKVKTYMAVLAASVH